jgi:hypothetical protein
VGWIRNRLPPIGYANERVFAALQLVLAVGDYTHAGLANGKISVLAPVDVRGDVVAADSNLLDRTDVTGLMKERSRLRHKILVDECRLLVLLGAAGTGKTALVQQLTAEIAPAFEYFVWQSLAPAPPIDTMLNDLRRSLLDPLAKDRQLPNVRKLEMRNLNLDRTRAKGRSDRRDIRFILRSS